MENMGIQMSVSTGCVLEVGVQPGGARKSLIGLYSNVSDALAALPEYLDDGLDPFAYGQMVRLTIYKAGLQQVTLNLIPYLTFTGEDDTYSLVPTATGTDYSPTTILCNGVVLEELDDLEDQELTCVISSAVAEMLAPYDTNELVVLGDDLSPGLNDLEG
jgi:hypothetical protein